MGVLSDPEGVTGMIIMLATFIPAAVVLKVLISAVLDRRHVTDDAEEERLRGISNQL